MGFSTPEVAEWDDLEADAESGGVPPMMKRRQCLTGELGVRCRFVPADAGDRKILFSLWIVPQLPACRSRPVGCVPKASEGLCPGELASVADERNLPVLPLLVPARIHEPFELPVGDLVAVDPEIADRTRLHYSGIGTALNANHVGRGVSLRDERDDEIDPVGEPRCRSHHQSGIESSLAEPDAENVSGDTQTVERRAPDVPPTRIAPSYG
jgi:hypothetical protein